MNKYLILQHPGNNAVFFASATSLALAELKIACKRLEEISANIGIEEIANLRYLSFETENALPDNDLQILSRLSFIFGIFKLEKVNDKSMLIPIPRDQFQFVDEKISSLLKYQGKTNIQFTRMMVNIALLSSDFGYDDKIRLLDPVAGKGTTMFEGIIHGFDVFGVEIEQKSVHEATVFFKKYLEQEKFKHSFDKHKLSGKKKSEAITKYDFKYARNKEEFQKEDNIKEFQMVAGNSQNASNYFKNESMHLIVGDLPYGIAHGNKGSKKSKSITRNPSELLDLCLSDWFKLLKKGGIVVIAWNSYVAGFDVLNEIFEKHGFEIMSDEVYGKFEHMVDKSIRRDIVVAKKK